MSLRVSFAIIPFLFVSFSAKAALVTGKMNCASDSGRTVITSNEIVGFGDQDITLTVDGESVFYSTRSDRADFLRVLANFDEGVFTVAAETRDGRAWKYQNKFELYALPKTVKVLVKNQGFSSYVTFKARISGTDPRKHNYEFGRDLDFDKKIYVNCVYTAED